MGWGYYSLNEGPKNLFSLELKTRILCNCEMVMEGKWPWSLSF